MGEKIAVFFPPLFPHRGFLLSFFVEYALVFVQHDQKSEINFVQYFFEKIGKTLDFLISEGYNNIKVVKSGEKFLFCPQKKGDARYVVRW